MVGHAGVELGTSGCISFDRPTRAWPAAGAVRHATREKTLTLLSFVDKFKHRKAISVLKDHIYFSIFQYITYMSYFKQGAREATDIGVVLLVSLVFRAIINCHDRPN